MQSKLIKPSYLVSLKSTLSGGISYKRIDLDAKKSKDKSEVTMWETTRVIDDKEEHERAVKARGKAVSLIRAICVPSSFGLICPLYRSDEFDKAVTEAKEVINEFNKDANHTKIDIFVLKGEIASSDEEAVRAISSEIVSLVEEMQAGIDKLDVKMIRDAANKARNTLAALGDEQSKIVNEAVIQARHAARKIVKQIEKNGENVDAVMAEIKRNELDRARAAFIDYSENEEIHSLPKSEQQRFADIEVTE